MAIPAEVWPTEAREVTEYYGRVVALLVVLPGTNDAPAGDGRQGRRPVASAKETG